MDNIIDNIDYENDLKDINSVNIPWNLLENKTVLVAGATGLIGSVIIDALMYRNNHYNANISVVALSRNLNKLNARFKSYLNCKNFKLISHDITLSLDINDNIDYIVDCASNADPKLFTEKPVDTLLTNIVGVKNLLDVCKNNPSCKLLYLSSGEVYGIGEIGMESFSESYSGHVDSLQFRSCYPIGKKAAENLCISYQKQYGLDVIIARPCHIYGATALENDQKVHSYIIKSALEQKDIVLKSHGLQRRSYCYVIDAVSAILTILLNGKSGEAYNVANSNSVITIYDLACLVGKLENVKVKICLANSQEQQSFNPALMSVLDASKLERLGWKAKYSIEDGIKQTLKILKSR